MDIRWYSLAEKQPEEDEQILVCNYMGEVFLSRKVQIELWDERDIEFVYEIDSASTYERTIDQKYIRCWMHIPPTPIDLENFYTKQEFYNEEDGNVLA